MAQRSVLVRALWFVAIGWWVTPLLVNLAWALNATVIGTPIGITLVNRVPTALTLTEPAGLERRGARSQARPRIRAVYFLLVGWWLSFFWANVAALLAVTILGLPTAIRMFTWLPYVTSLHRSTHPP